MVKCIVDIGFCFEDIGWFGFIYVWGVIGDVVDSELYLFNFECMFVVEMSDECV